MRVAHLIMAYKNPLQLERLIKRLEHPNCDVYIHLDKKIDNNEFAKLGQLDRVFFINNRILCNWGGFSFVHAIIASIKEILTTNEGYEFINLMSGQDYPIKPIDTFYDFLINNNGYSFISYEELGKSDWWKHAISRFELYHFTDIKIKGRYLVQRIVNKVLPKRIFPMPYLLYGSAVSSWWTISVDCAKYIISYLEKSPKLMHFMKYTWGADEFLFPTIVMNSPFRERVINNNLRYIDWEEGSSNPVILKTKDLECLKKTPQLFARKFDTEVDVNILDELDKYLSKTI